MGNYFFFTVFISVTAATAQTVQLPQGSNVYPDTFAIYWRKDRPATPDPGEVAIQLQLNSVFDDALLQLDASTDTLIVMFCDPEYNAYGGFVIQASFSKNGKRIPLYREVEKGFKIIPKSPRIAALIDLVRTNHSVNNLLLLADAYEAEQCFANAFYIYRQIILKEFALGQKYFNAFYKRNYSRLAVSYGNVER